MRNLILVSTLLLSVSTFASSEDSNEADPRNTSTYRMIFDMSAESSSPIVNNFGGYIQVHVTGDATLFRFCDNFEGSGTSGRPNPAKARRKLVPIGVTDPTGYRCHDYSEDQAAAGVPMVKFGSKSFLAMKTVGWTAASGGQILFQFAQTISVLGSPKYKTLRLRATRTSGELSYLVETLIPRAEVIPTHLMHFKIPSSGLGLPNGVSAIILNPRTRAEHSVDLNNLEGPIQISGMIRRSRR